MGVNRSEPQQGITPLLLDWAEGDEGALEKLMPLVYSELRRIARRKTNREKTGYALDSTGLVHELYLRLIQQKNAQWKNRSQFFAIAAKMMRRILVDYARKRERAKRGGATAHESLTMAEVPVVDRGKEILAVNDALDDLAGIDERKARIVELRYFAGLTVQETAEILDIAPRTVIREWGIARAWLHRAITKQPVGDEV
jgi:RNA polymerase sigma factor (TIGR02999 family)